MKKKNDKNYLEKIPVHPEGIPWKTDENGIVTLETENKGAMNRIAQKLFKSRLKRKQKSRHIVPAFLNPK